MDKPLNVAVADFHPYTTMGIITELKSEEALRVVATFQNLDEVENKLISLKLDLLIISLWFRNISSIDLIKKLHTTNPKLRIIIYSQEERLSHVKEVLNYVNGYILKSEPEGTLLKAIKRVLANKKAISEDIREGLELESRFNYILSTQESKIIHFRAEGMNPNNISEQLSISEKTVRKHIDNARKKLGFHSTEEMIRWFWQQT